MLKPLDAELNELLVDTFRAILRVEEDTLKSSGNINLSISELHLLEAVGKNSETGRTISDIAQELNITPPSVTIAINKLVKKGYVEKSKSTDDGRMVFVVLTRLGRKIDRVHRYFHAQMIRNINEALSEEERAAMTRGIKRINAFFNQKGEQMEKK